MRQAMWVPDGEILPWKARGMSIGSSTPPCAGTVQKRGAPLGAAVARPEAKTMALPSGVQPCTLSAPGCHVKRFGSPPSGGATETAKPPAYSAPEADHLPCGGKSRVGALPRKPG